MITGNNTTGTAELSVQAKAIWAKTGRDESGQLDSWLPLYQHLADTAAVCGYLWDSWLPLLTKSLISSGMGIPAAQTRQAVCWLAGVHDVGKATPAFEVQVPLLAEALKDAGLTIGHLPDRKLLPHALAGQVILEQWLMERWAIPKVIARQWAMAVGGHHGVMPESGQLLEAPLRLWLLGDPTWRSVQFEFLDHAAQTHSVLGLIPSLGSTQISQPAQVLTSALVIVSDWIASNPDFFPAIPLGRNFVAGSDQLQHRTTTGVQLLNLPGPWRAEPSHLDPDTMFMSRFAIGNLARPLQKAAVEVARTASTPALMIIEAPMGEGKTEAALLAAETFASRIGAGGCFVALPTQATTNAMFTRCLRWLKRLPNKAAESTTTSAFLAHGKAHLNEDFRGLVREGRFQSIGDSDTCEAGDSADAEGTVIAHQWLSGRKKGVLADFVVGTIDQLLFVGLKSRHLALRHLSVAGKVVIIDECHAYDSYMSVYLMRAVEWLGAYGVPTIVLSATLPSDRRRALLEAYDKGRDSSSRSSSMPVSIRGSSSTPAYPELDGDIGYPAIVFSGAISGSAAVRIVEGQSRTQSVVIVRLPDDDQTLVDLLRERLSEGGCAVVIRNTVQRAQQTARMLIDQLDGIPISVAHARFLSADRAMIDTSLVKAFGPVTTGRPRTHVVVATQVVEQSLDIDFDLMVTDIAPIDLVLQRMGRLHRHARGENQSNRPPKLRTAVCYLTGVDWDAAVPHPERGSKAVYGHYHLLRTLAVLNLDLEGRRVVRLPGDIAPLVQTAYGTEAIGPQDWQPQILNARTESERERSEREVKAKTFLVNPVGKPGKPIVGWQHAGVGDINEDDPRGQAQVRDSGDSLEVVVAQHDGDGNIRICDWLDGGGELIPTDFEVPARLAIRLVNCTLRLPPRMCLPRVIDKVIAALEGNLFPGWQKSPWLKGQLVLLLDNDRQVNVAGFHLVYNQLLGLEMSIDE